MVKGKTQGKTQFKVEYKGNPTNKIGPTEKKRISLEDKAIKMLTASETGNPYFNGSIIIDSTEKNICFNPQQNMCSEFGYPNTQISIRRVPNTKIFFYTALIEQQIPFMIVVYNIANSMATAMARTVSFQTKNNMTDDENNNFANVFYDWMINFVPKKDMYIIPSNNLRFFLILGINSTADIDTSENSIGQTINTLIIQLDEQNAAAEVKSLIHSISLPLPPPATEKGGKSKRNKSKRGTKRRNKSKKRKTRKYKK